MEQQNSISINVFGYYDGSDGIEAAGYFPKHISTAKYDDVLNVLMITNNFTQHFVLITNVSGFLSANSKDGHRKFFCYRCFKG